MLTEQQEEKLESLYKEKSKLIPNKTYFSPKESINPGRKKFQKSRGKIMY
jgi:putative NADH-flavin reductase